MRAERPNRDPIDPRRRAVIVAGGALVLGAAFRPLRAAAQTKQRIGVIGSGHIGGTIGGLWVKAGHPVLFSSRHPDELKDLVTGFGELAQAGTVDQAIAFSDVLFIAVPYAALPQIGRDYGAALKGKIMLDACNAVAPRDGNTLADEVEQEGVGVVSQKYLSGARLVRAFNTLNYTRSSPARRTGPIRSSRCRSPATIPKRSRPRPHWCATPVSIRSWSASLQTPPAFSAARRVTARRSPPPS
jgi:8-hydroxy-5-deazaflavin:NADPH oxidoreductase